MSLLIWTCGEDKPVTPHDETPQPLKYRNEAEQLAIYNSGELLPPEVLTRQIDHELDLIRSTWSDSGTWCLTEYLSPWGDGEVSVRVDQDLYDQILAGTNAQWNGLIDSLKLRVHDFKWDWYPRYLSLIPTVNMHPVRLAERFVGFPGIELVQTGGVLQSWFSYYTRVCSAPNPKYYFKACICPDVYNDYTYFEIDGDSAKFMGIHHECLHEYTRETIDSLEANRAAWVDSARHAISEFSNYPGFSWTRQ